MQPAVAAGLGVDARLDRGRGGGEHDRRLFEPARAPPPCRARCRRRRPPACRRPRAPRRRRSGRGRRTAGRGRSARRRPPAPRRSATAAQIRSRWRSAQAGVPFGRPRAEARREAVEELGGERDLRQEHQRLPPLPQSLGDRLEIDFGLARAGDAVEQGGEKARAATRPTRSSAAGSGRR